MHRSPASLSRLGLRMDEAIRFRRHERGRWIVGRVVGIEYDGSIAIRDPDGSARSLRAERVEVRRPGSRGRLRWWTVSEVAVTWEQLEMFADDGSASGGPVQPTPSAAAARSAASGPASRRSR